MTEDEVRAVINSFKDGKIGEEAALGALSGLSEKDLGFAVLDSRRELRQGYPEVVYAAGKTEQQFRAILSELLKGSAPLLATRVPSSYYEAVKDLSADLVYDPLSRTVSARRSSPAAEGPYAAIVSAGTSDMPVAEEAAVTAEVFGCRVERVYDVGVAGIQRLFRRLDTIRGAAAVVAVAGMEGALASVVGGLVDVPVIAVPTSVGYGASFGGLSALLTMLNSCAAGVSVVNIDNGFGAGYLACMIAKPPRRS